MTFASAAPIYRSLGWAGTLPLPAGQKSNPPDGYTGGAGVDPDDAMVAAWSGNGYAAGNIALRMPDDVVGLDIDAYDAWRPRRDPATGAVSWGWVRKRGAETLGRLEAALGPLPATYRSSARPAPSGVRLYRVPAGMVITESNIPGDIEVLRRGHRYMVAPPSINPETSTAYGWTYGAGDRWVPVAPPRRDQVPVLPGAWAVMLSSRPAAAVPVADFWQSAKSTESAARQWRNLRDRMVGFVRRCEMFGWGGDAHGQLLEMTRELAQLSPEHARTAVGAWFREGGAGWVDQRVWAMLDSALSKYPADKIVAPTVVLPVSSVAAELPPAYVAAGATMGSDAYGHQGGLGVQIGRADGPSVAPTPVPSSIKHDHASLHSGAPGISSAGVVSAHHPPDTRRVEASIPPADQREQDGERAAPRRLPMIPDPVWEAYGWTRSVRAQARAADVCPDAVLGAVLATYAARIPPGVRIVTGTKMPLGTNLVVSLVGPSGSDKSTAFTLAQKIMPGSAVPVINNPGSGEAFAASFVHADPDGEGAVSKRTKVLKPDPRALFYVAEGGLLGSIGARLGSTWLPHLRSLAVDESLSTTNATAEINRQVPAQSYSAGVVVGFQVTTATTVLHDTGTGTAQRFLWFTSLSTEDLPPGAGTDAPNTPMAVPVLTRLGAGIDEENRPIHYLAVTQSITDRIKAEQRHYRLTRDITSSDDHDAHRHTLVAKLAALAVLADDRVMIEEYDWAWAEAVYTAAGSVRDELLSIAEESANDVVTAGAQRQGRADQVRRQYDSDEARVAQIILRRVQRGDGPTRRQLKDSVASRDRGLASPAVEQLEMHGWISRDEHGKFYVVSRE